MATTPHFKTLFNRVQQPDRQDEALAEVAMLGATKLDNIRQQAEVLGLPKRGPYYPYIDADMLAQVLMSRGLVGTIWKESKELGGLPDVAVAMVDYDADWEVGRCMLFHRLPADNPSKVAQCVLDPLHQIRREDESRVRQEVPNSLKLTKRCGPGIRPNQPDMPMLQREKTPRRFG